MGNTLSGMEQKKKKNPPAMMKRGEWDVLCSGTILVTSAVAIDALTMGMWQLDCRSDIGN
jgi:hypothetical protein